MAENPRATNVAVAPPAPDVPDEMEQSRRKLIETSLCCNCKHLGECVYPLKAAAPIIECEMYVCGPPATPLLIVVKTRQGLSQGSPPPGADEASGLCANCDNLPHCRLPKHPGGVWHCEEYE